MVFFNTSFQNKFTKCFRTGTSRPPVSPSPVCLVLASEGTDTWERAVLRVAGPSLLWMGLRAAGWRSAGFICRRLSPKCPSRDPEFLCVPTLDRRAGITGHAL